jgi:hypothetical protein
VRILKTIEISPAEFSARFGTDKVTSGPFSYYVIDNGVGVVKDNSKRSIEVVAASEIDLIDISVEDELLLLALVCGEYKEEINIPQIDTLWDYEERELTSKKNLHWIWLGFGTVSILFLVIGAYVYYY